MPAQVPCSSPAFRFDGNGTEVVSTKSTAHTFEKVATTINVYKLAKFWSQRLESQPSFPSDRKQSLQSDLKHSENMLLKLVDNLEELPPSSRQQLYILYCELQAQGEIFDSFLLPLLYNRLIGLSDRLKTAKLGKLASRWFESGRDPVVNDCPPPPIPIQCPGACLA